jgi:peptidylprolyl isomerase/FKBP-type peptidyl-prolyl cis-trans isomerase SlyD
VALLNYTYGLNGYKPPKGKNYLVNLLSDEEKIKSTIELHYANPNVDIDKTEISIEDGVVNIQMDEMSKFDQQSYMDVTFARFRISKDVWENIEGVTKVNFVDAFEKREEKEEDEEVAEEVTEATEE